MDCRRCNRELKNPDSIRAGIGPVCAAKQAIAEAAGEEQPVLLGVGSLAEVGLICQRREDGQLATNVRQVFKWHSPTGFECGYAGSGPADLALNVLAALVAVGSDGAEGWKIWDGQKVSATAGLLHQDFKERFIATMPRTGGMIPIEEINTWLDAKRAEASFKERLATYMPVTT